MKPILLVISLIISLPATAETQAPGVWDSLQQGGTTKARILEVKTVDGVTPTLRVTFESEDQLGQKVTRTQELCPPKDSTQTEVWTALEYQRNRQKLEKAEQSKQPIEIRTGSIWNSCLSAAL